MSKKRILIILLLLFLIFASTYGSAIEQVYQNDSSTEGVFISVFLYCLIVCAVMMFIPAVCRLKNKARLPRNKGLKICKWNSIILFVISSIMLIIMDASFIGGLGAVIFYFINKWVFVVDDVETDIPQYTYTPSEEAPLEEVNKPAVNQYNFCPKCGNNLIAGSLFCGKCGTKIGGTEHDM